MEKRERNGKKEKRENNIGRKVRKECFLAEKGTH